MHMISLSSLIEEAAFHQEGVRRDRGNVVSLDKLLQPESLAQLEARYPAFAFLAFDPAGDRAVVEYISSGTVADDSGKDILTLVISPRTARVPRRVRAEEFAGVEILHSELEAERLINTLFEGTTVPPLPGVALFNKFSDNSETIFFSLSGPSTNDIRTRLRQIFSLANDAIRKCSADDHSAFAETLAMSAQRSRLDFARSGPISMRQWLIKVYQFVGHHSGDLVSLINLAKGLL